MDKTGTVGKKWLVSELLFSFWALKKCAKTQSNPIILLKVIMSIGDIKTLKGSQNVEIL